MTPHRPASPAATALSVLVIALMVPAMLTAAACGPSTSADAPVVTYYYIPG